MWGGLRSLPHTSWCSVLHPISLCGAFCLQTQCLKEADTGLPSRKEKPPYSLSPVPGGSQGKVMKASQPVDRVLTPGFIFPAISACCLPTYPPSLGNFQGWSSKSTAVLETSWRRRAGRGLGGKGVPRSVHKKQISCCCPGSPAHISSLTESAARLQVTSRCFHSSQGHEGTHHMGVGLTASSGVGNRTLL